MGLAAQLGEVWTKKKEVSEPTACEKGNEQNTMEELERLTEIVKQLVEQVKTVADTMMLGLQKQEQMYKTYEGQLSILPQQAETLKLLQEDTEVINQALEDSIGGVDQAANDITKATSSLLTIVQPALQALAKAAVEQA